MMTAKVNVKIAERSDGVERNDDGTRYKLTNIFHYLDHFHYSIFR